MNHDAEDRAGLLKELVMLRERLSAIESGLGERDASGLELCRSRALLDNISDLAYVCDDNGNIMYVNRAFEKLSGHAASEFIGRPFSTLFSESDLIVANEAYLKTLKGGSPVFEISFLMTGRLCEYHNHPFRDKDGNIIGVLGIARDITERKKSFDELEEKEYLLRESQRVARLGSYVLDISSGLWECSETLYEIFGIHSGMRRDFELWKKILHPEHRDEMVEYFLNGMLAGLSDFDREYRIVRLNDRAERWVHGLGKLIFDGDRKLVRMIGTIQDITEKKKTEERLREANQNLEEVVRERTRHLSASKRKYRDLVDTIQHGIEECDTSGVITFCNPAYARMYGYEPQQLIGMKIFDLYAFDAEREALREFFVKVVDQRPPSTPYFGKHITKDGQFIDVRIDWNYKYGDTGELAGFISVITDITEHKRALEALKGSESRLNDAQRVAKIGSLTWDVEKDMVQPSDEFLRIFDVSRKSCEENPYVILKSIHPEDRDEVDRRRNVVFSGRKPRLVGEYRVLREDGTVREIHSEADITYDREGKPSFLIATVQDITEKKHSELEKERLQAQLLHSQKMEAIGTMAGGIAHDFNNIMTVINSLTGLMMQKTGPDDPFHKYLQPISDSCRRAVNLVQQLLLFSSRRPKKMSSFCMNEAVSELTGFFEHLLSEDVIVDLDLKHGLWEITADRSRIEQVITNLVLNSSEAMAHGGRVTVRTRNMVVSESLCAGTPGASPGRHICLIVEDSGTGIDPEVLKHVFEPFYTTKKAKNSGMGLAVVYGVVKEHNGWVTVESQLGAGAVFKVFLPAASADGDAKDHAAPKEFGEGGGKRVLIVEDEKLVRRSAAIVLEEHGYEVFEASDAESALKVFKRNKGKFDLVLSDVVMPGQSGLRLITELLEKSRVPVLLCSGYLDDKAQLSEIISNGFAFLQKPYDVSELLYAVEDTIRQHGAWQGHTR